MEYRPDFWPRNEAEEWMSVLEMCDVVHQATRSNYGHFVEDIDLYVRCLEWLRDNWKHPTSMWDRALLTLVVRTLNERLPEPKGPPDIICRKSDITG